MLQALRLSNPVHEKAWQSDKILLLKIKLYAEKRSRKDFYSKIAQLIVLEETTGTTELNVEFEIMFSLKHTMNYLQLSIFFLRCIKMNE